MGDIVRFDDPGSQGFSPKMGVCGKWYSIHSFESEGIEKIEFYGVNFKFRK